MSLAIAPTPHPLPTRFGYLMGLYGENYHRLARLFAPQKLAQGVYLSSVDDGIDVRLDVLEKQRYTLDLKLSYIYAENAAGENSPVAHLRMYHDAHVAEAMHCEAGKQLWHVLGPFPKARSVFQHRMRMNSFLNRWLEYLAEQGHSLGTIEPAPSLSIA